MSFKKALTHKETVESLAKEWFATRKEENKTTYSKQTLHFKEQVKAILLTIDFQADEKIVFDSVKIALSEIYDKDVRISKLKNPE
jgi:hypothetical protein